MQVDDQNIGQVIDLLVTGFPTRSRRFWERGIARLKNLDAHRTGGFPIGHTLTVENRIVGVGLTAVNTASSYSAANAPATCNGADHGTATCINLTSWYIEPEHRWRMPLLLKPILKDKSAIYTDLTPTVGVQPILKTLGFTPINSGVKLINTAAAAVRTRGDTRVQTWDRMAQTGADPQTSRMLADHVALGCFAFVIATPDDHAIVLLKPGRIKGAPCAQVVYCSRNAVLERAIGALSRKLFTRGILALIVDIPTGQTERSSVTQIALPNRRKRFIRNAVLNGATDYAYSELVLFDL